MDVPELHKGADVSKLPPALRCLASFNQTGWQEAEEVAAAAANGGEAGPAVVTEAAGAGTAAAAANANAPLAPVGKIDPFNEMVSNTPRNKLPACLRALLDHNPKGYDELAPTRGVRTAKVKTKIATETAKKVEPVRAPAHHSFPLDDVRRWVLPGPLKNTPSAKVWCMMSTSTHRRFKANLGSLYEYKQCMPTPHYLRKHRYPFKIHVQQPGELIVSCGHSHSVISGNSRGFSWSHVDPATIERIEHSDRFHGSRQADGKPNSFSELFHRSTIIMDALRSNLMDPDACWSQSEEDAKAHVEATASCAEHHAARLAEGWLAEEVLPLYTPSMEQMNNPFWFTAMMSGPGKENGSLHIRLPIEWSLSREHNYGHVAWSPAANLWKLNVNAPTASKDVNKVRAASSCSFCCCYRPFLFRALWGLCVLSSPSSSFAAWRRRECGGADILARGANMAPCYWLGRVRTLKTNCPLCCFFVLPSTFVLLFLCRLCAQRSCGPSRRGATRT